MGKRIFKHEEHQNLFDKQGFIVLPFLHPDEITRLDELFDELHPNLAESGFVSSSYSSDLHYKQKASAEIVNVFTRAYLELFIDYTPFGGAFLYKMPGENSELAAHQDWTIVDEKEHVALNCWVPLCDVTSENGALSILPGSHFDNLEVIRAPTLPFFFSGNDDAVLKELIPMEVKAGTAVILNQSVIHYSPPNRSSNIRKAITAGVKSKGAQMIFHYKVPDKNELEVFEMEDDFLIRFNDFAKDISKRPYLGRSIKKIPCHFTQVSFEKLNDQLKQMKTAAGYEMSSSPHKIADFKNNPPAPTENKKTWWEKLFG